MIGDRFYREPDPIGIGSIVIRFSMDGQGIDIGQIVGADESLRAKARPGMVCYSVRWDRDGRVREALYRPVEKPLPPAADDVTGTKPRGALAAERQGQLL